MAAFPPKRYGDGTGDTSVQCVRDCTYCYRVNHAPAAPAQHRITERQRAEVLSAIEGYRKDLIPKRWLSKKIREILSR